MTDPDSPFSLSLGDIRRIHHVGIPYQTNQLQYPNGPPPDVLERIQKFWEALGMRREVIFVKTSPDRGTPGWRLHVGSVRDPIELTYRPFNKEVIEKLRLSRMSTDVVLETVHICFEVGPETLRLLEKHPSFEKTTSWGNQQGRHSVLIRGPIGEEIEFTCSLAEAPDDRP